MQWCYAHLRDFGEGSSVAGVTSGRSVALEIMTKRTYLLLLALLGGCGKKSGGGPDEKPEPKSIGSTGAVIDAPANWEVAEEGKISYRVGAGNGRQVFVTEMAFTPKDLEEFYKDECGKFASGPGIKETTPAGALYVECKTKSQTRDGKPVDLTTIRSIVRVGDHGVRCRVETDGDPTTLSSVCKSLRVASK
jgi:hypothetical protein